MAAGEMQLVPVTALAFPCIGDIWDEDFLGYHGASMGLW